MNFVQIIRASVVASLVAVVLTGATGCASTVFGATTISSRTTRNSDFPIDVQIAQSSEPAHAPVVSAATSFGPTGG